jgi:hypothetical protein
MMLSGVYNDSYWNQVQMDLALGHQQLIER